MSKNIVSSIVSCTATCLFLMSSIVAMEAVVNYDDQRRLANSHSEDSLMSLPDELIGEVAGSISEGKFYSLLKSTCIRANWLLKGNGFISGDWLVSRPPLTPLTRDERRRVYHSFPLMMGVTLHGIGRGSTRLSEDVLELQKMTSLTYLNFSHYDLNSLIRSLNSRSIFEFEELIRKLPLRYLELRKVNLPMDPKERGSLIKCLASKEFTALNLSQSEAYTSEARNQYPSGILPLLLTSLRDYHNPWLSLQSLDLDSASFLFARDNDEKLNPYEAFSQILKYTPNLTELALSKILMKDEDFLTIAESLGELQKLVTLSLYGNNLTNAIIPSIITLCQTVQTLESLELSMGASLRPDPQDWESIMDQLAGRAIRISFTQMFRMMPIWNKFHSKTRFFKPMGVAPLRKH